MFFFYLRTIPFSGLLSFPLLLILTQSTKKKQKSYSEMTTVSISNFFMYVFLFLMCLCLYSSLDAHVNSASFIATGLLEPVYILAFLYFGFFSKLFLNSIIKHDIKYIHIVKHIALPNELFIFCFK